MRYLVAFRYVNRPLVKKRYELFRSYGWKRKSAWIMAITGATHPEIGGKP